jgi:hypothetical protein
VVAGRGVLMTTGRVLLILGALGAYLAFFGVLLWRQRRERRQTEVAQQLREMEQAIWEESLPDDQREALQVARAQRADIRREARRRLGLPEEEHPAC